MAPPLWSRTLQKAKPCDVRATVTTESGRFRAAFERWARLVRTRQALRRALTGSAIGLAVGAAGAGALWKARLGAYRPWSAAAGLVGAGVGLALARRRAWTDGHVALYLDGCLDTRETIATAAELDVDDANGADESARVVVIARAADALEKGDAKKIRPAVLETMHVAIPLAGAALAYLAWIPVPPPPTKPVPPGTERVQLAEVLGLEKVAELAKISPRDDEQKKRLDQIVDDARKLREKLRTGMEKREAQAEIAKLRDEIAAEKLSLGDGEHRAGFEAAVGRLSQQAATKGAAKALGDRDLKGFDEELEKLADQREKHDREEAHKALEEAEALAEKGGAKDVAKMLAKERELMKKREGRAEKLRELAEALGNDLPDDAKKDLDDWESAPSDRSAEKLADSLGKALEKLTPEERKRLAENLKKQMQPGDASGAVPPSMRRQLAEQLATPEGQKELEEQLKRLANEGLEGDEAERQKALEDAERGGADAEGQIGGRPTMPMPMPMAGNGAPGPSGNGNGSGNGKGDQQGNGASANGKGPGGDASGSHSPGGGHSEDTGHGDHAGHTDPVGGDGVTARAHGRIDHGVAMPGVAMGRAPGRPGETANIRGTGALGQVGPDEVGGVERSDVPEEYREQVGRYFHP